MKGNIFKVIQIILLSLIIGVAVARFYFQKNLMPHHDIEKEAQVLTEKIENVSKLVLVEGTFSEVFSYKDAYKMFYDYLSFEKKAIIKVNAKAAISIDLRKLEYDIDPTNKRLILHQIPEPELMIEPDLQYYDLQESSFNEFSVQELNSMNKDAIQQIRDMIKDSNLYDMARARVVEEIRDIQLLSDYMDWEIIDKTGAQSLKSFEELQVIER